MTSRADEEFQRSLEPGGLEGDELLNQRFHRTIPFVFISSFFWKMHGLCAFFFNPIVSLFLFSQV